MDIAGPNPVLEQAMTDGYITDREGWKKMKKSRELTSHTYNSETAEDIAEDIIARYYPLLKDLESKLEELRSGKQNTFFSESGFTHHKHVICYRIILSAS